MIVGKRVRLRPIERDDLPRFVAWLGDPEVCVNLALVLGPGLAQEERWYESVLALPPLDQPLAVEALEDVGSWRHVGSAGMHGVDWRNRSAEIGLFLGDKSVWDRGLGTELTELLLRHAFADLNLHRVWLRVFADNARARRVYEKAGFRLEGTQREADYRDGHYRDVLVYSVLAPEWGARREGRAGQGRKPTKRTERKHG
jgi:diamine N-acetyltransferase